MLSFCGEPLEVVELYKHIWTLLLRKLGKKTISAIVLAFVLLSVSIMVFKVQPAKARTIIVPDEYPTIQAAINAANDGDTVSVRSGTYLESVSVRRSIRLVGWSPHTTKIDGEKDLALAITADDVSVSGFTLASSKLREGDPSPHEEDLFIVWVEGSNCVISNNIVQGVAETRWVTGILLVSCSNNNVENNRIRDLHTDGVRIWLSNSNVIRNNVINNTSLGINVVTSQSNAIEGNIITYTNPDYPSPYHDPMHKHKGLLPPSGISLYLDSQGNQLIENTVVNNGVHGLSIGNRSSYNLVVGNVISSNGIFKPNSWESNYNVWVNLSTANRFYHNYFDDRSTTCSVVGSNLRDNGYPSGGNFWKEYAAEDSCSGTSQNQQGSDGIFDYPYFIDENEIDRYPLIDLEWVDKKVHNLDTDSHYLTIQEAVYASETLNGHTIVVDKGLRYEHITINKSISLIGENVSTTFIDGYGIGSVIKIIASNVKLCNFTIQNSGTHEILVANSSNAVLRNNSIDNIAIEAREDAPLNYFIHDIDASNLVNGKQVIYWINRHEGRIPSNAGFVAVVNSSNIIVDGLKATNNSQGIFFAYTNSSIIMNPALLNNNEGIRLHRSFNNILKSNYFARNLCGIGLTFSSGNRIHHNNFIENTIQAYTISSSNAWDDSYPSGGNYWRDYSGFDSNNDSIGDTPYIINENNTDNHPLMKSYAIQASVTLPNPVVSVLPIVTHPVTCFIELPKSYSVDETNVRQSSSMELST